jgi:hypothetical protein
LRRRESRAICTISRLVVRARSSRPTSMTFLPANSIDIGLSFWRTERARTACPGMMKVRPM